jgi:hypothetical protein
MPGLAWSAVHLFIRVTKTGSRRRGRQHTHAATRRTGTDVVRFDDCYRLARASQLYRSNNAGLAATNNKGVAGIR